MAIDHAYLCDIVLSVTQFKRFMEVIKKLGDRVEKEHDQYLRDSQRIEDRSAISGANGTNGTSAGGTVDFESLVGGGNAPVKPDTVGNSSTSWDDDPWGSIFANNSAPQVRIDFIFSSAERCSKGPL